MKAEIHLWYPLSMFDSVVRRIRSFFQHLFSIQTDSVAGRSITPLTLFQSGNTIYVLAQETNQNKQSIIVYEWVAGAHFERSKKQITKSPFGNTLTHSIHSISIQQYGATWYMMWSDNTGSFVSTGKSPWNWTVSKPIMNVWDDDLLIPGNVPSVVGGNITIGIGTLQKTKSGYIVSERSQIPTGYNWHSAYGEGIARKPLGAVVADDQHIALFIQSSWTGGDGISAVFCNIKNPLDIRWRGNGIISVIPTNSRDKSPNLIGVVKINELVQLFWNTDNTITRTTVNDILPRPEKTSIASVLKRAQDNPIISPIPFHNWENVATFNPAAFVLNDAVHLLYRAVGNDGVSRIGYAKSCNGVTIDERYAYPIYAPDFDDHVPYSPRLNMLSGSPGGYSRMGCEDPRVTIVGDRIYLMFAAYNGYEDARAAYTSIAISDFQAHQFNWAPIVYLSAPPGGAATGRGNKSICILPEKHNGKYVIYHRMWPNICIDMVENLTDFFTEHGWLSGQIKIPPRPGFWDSGKLGIGAPPIKTNIGWLIIYQGISARPYERGYLMGAMLCDLDNPGQVIARGHFPVLIPQEPYELNGCTPHVVYPCGAVIHQGTLFVYYGAADTTVAVAQTDLDTFLQTLLTNPVIEPESCELQIV